MRAGRYLIRRAGRGVLTLLIMVAVTVGLYRAIETQPPVRDYFADRTAPVTPAETKLVRRLFELDRSAATVYVDHVSHLARGDLGTSRTIEDGQIVDTISISATVYPALRATLSILIGGAVLVLLLAIPLGAISGSRVGSWSDRAS